MNKSNPTIHLTVRDPNQQSKDFRGQNFRNASFAGCDCTSSDFRHCVLDNCDFKGADLTSCTFDAVITSFSVFIAIVGESNVDSNTVWTTGYTNDRPTRTFLGRKADHTLMTFTIDFENETSGFS